MKDKITQKRRTINLVFVLIACAFLGYSTYRLVADYLLEQKAVEVNAKIVEVEAATIGYKAHVTYKVEDTTYDQYHVDLGLQTNLTVGDYTKIKYNINNPAKLIKNNHTIILAITGSITLILFVVFLPGRIKIIKNSSNQKRLKKEGLVIETDIQDIIINNRGKKYKKTYPYRLRSKYLNPTDNKEYIFESEDTFANPNDVITKYQTKKVKVYLDKTNTKNYFVDLGSLVPEIEVVDPREYMKQFYKKAEPVQEEQPKEEENKKEEK